MVRDALSHYWGGPKLTTSPLLKLQVVQESLADHDDNPVRALRSVLAQAIEKQRPHGERRMTTAEWLIYNILELKFVQGMRVRDIAQRLAMSEADLYRKQRLAIEEVARTLREMETGEAIDLSASQPELVEMIRAFPRQALHAFELRLTHPGELNTTSFNAPLPEDLEALLAGLDRYAK